MDKRTFNGAARIVGKTVPMVHRMAKRNGWEERALAWDREVQRRIDQAELNEIARMARRQVSIAIGMQTLIAHDIGCMLKQAERDEYRARMDPEYERKPVMKPSDLSKMVDIATKLERLNRGEPSDITKTVASIDQDMLSRLSTEELEQLNKLLGKLGQ